MRIPVPHSTATPDESACADRPYENGPVTASSSNRNRPERPVRFVPVNHPTSPPIYQSSAWEFASLAEAEAINQRRVYGVEYGTRRVPNQLELEKVLASWHQAEEAVVTTGGMAAHLAVLMGTLGPGDRLVASRDLFGVTVKLLELLAGWQVEVAWVDVSDLDAVRAEVARGARVLLAETISNPRLAVADLPALAAMAHEHGADFVVDNTFATPYHCRPLEHGADLVIESVTKGLAGHHDVVLGAVAGGSSSVVPVRRFVDLTSTSPPPIAAWLAARGMETFLLRQRRSAETAAALAARLNAREEVVHVDYPGLACHPSHEVAASVLEDGFGAVLSFEIDGEQDTLEAFVAGLETIRLAGSLGGTVTMAAHPWTMSHRWLEPDERRARGIREGLLRLSVGTEELEEIFGDLERGFATLRRSDAGTKRTPSTTLGKSVRRGGSTLSKRRGSDSPERRLRELGYELPPPPAPTGLYVGAVRHGSIVYLSGHASGDLQGGWREGVLGDTMSDEEGKAAVRDATLACLATLRAEIGSLDAVDRFLKVFGMLRATGEYRGHPEIMDACTGLLIDVFGPRGHHARSAVGMASLPFGTVVEIEMVVAVADSPGRRSP